MAPDATFRPNENNYQFSNELLTNIIAVIVYMDYGTLFIVWPNEQKYYELRINIVDCSRMFLVIQQKFDPGKY